MSMPLPNKPDSVIPAITLWLASKISAAGSLIWDVGCASILGDNNDVIPRAADSEVTI